MRGASFLSMSDGSVRGPRQMGKAIFFAITRDPEFKGRIAQLGRAAGCAVVQRLIITARLDLETLPSAGDFLSLAESLNRFGPEENEIIAQGGNQGEAIGIGLGDEGEKKKGGVNPRQPLDLYRQNKEEVDHVVGIEVGEGKEDRREQHLVRELAAGNERGCGRTDHPDQKIQGQAEGAPGLLELASNIPKEPDGHQDEKRMRHLGNEDVGDEPPDFSGANPADVEREIGVKALVQVTKDEDENAKGDDGADQSGNGDKTNPPFEFVQEPHRSDTVEEAARASTRMR